MGVVVDGVGVQVAPLGHDDVGAVVVVVVDVVVVVGDVLLIVGVVLLDELPPPPPPQPATVKVTIAANKLLLNAEALWVGFDFIALLLVG